MDGTSEETAAVGDDALGELSVLNVGAGDIVVTFNRNDAGETAKALRMLRDMQRQGYAILVQLEDGEYTRVVDVDATRGRYIIQLPEGEAELAGPDAEPVGAAVETCHVIGHAEDGAELVCMRPRFPVHAGQHETASGLKFSVRRGAKRLKPEGRGRKRTDRVAKPIRTSRAVGVARSAGG